MKLEKMIRLLMAPCALLASLSVIFLPQQLGAQNVPRYEVDALWPKLPLPDRWVTGGLGGTCVDNQDHVFVLNRQNVVDQDLELGISAPPVIEFDAAGNVVNSWGDPKVLGGRLHDCYVDKENNIWVIGSQSGFLQKYTHDGTKLLLQVGKSGVFDSSDGTNKGTALNSNNPQFFYPSSIAVDPQNGDLYVADGETTGGNHRIAVLSRDGKFLRQWQLRRSEAEKNLPQVVHCIGLSNDGLVYMSDRQGHRIQVFDKMGSFKRSIDIPSKPNTPGGKLRSTSTDGAATVFEFSPDTNQKYLFVVNQNSNVINIVDRQTGQILSAFGRGAGRYPAQFTTPHGIAVDSKGNVYIAEQEGRRIQKFNVVGQ
jgi:DNA-binding beta-propeller fold protein YncE